MPLKTRGKQNKDDLLWRSRVDHTRSEAMRVLASIKNGTVDENDLDMLNNFVQFSLALMQMEGPKKWALAKMNAEIMSLNNGN
jgi:hypothetical protein